MGGLAAPGDGAARVGSRVVRIGTKDDWGQNWIGGLANAIDTQITGLMEDEIISQSDQASYLAKVRFRIDEKPLQDMTVGETELTWKANWLQIVRGTLFNKNAIIVKAYLGYDKGYLPHAHITFIQNIDEQTILGSNEVLVSLTLYALVEDAIRIKKPTFVVCALIEHTKNFADAQLGRNQPNQLLTNAQMISNNMQKLEDIIHDIQRAVEKRGNELCLKRGH